MTNKTIQQTRRKALTLALLLCAAGGAQAQTNAAGAVTGRATSGDTITISNPATGFSRTITAGADGGYRFSQLPTGQYQISQNGRLGLGYSGQLSRNDKDHAVTVKLTLAVSLPMVSADRTLMVQVIVNLVQNAIDAMEHCPPAYRQLSVSTIKGADDTIVVSVADQGEGIPEAIGEGLYAPFFTTKSQGLGLGLSICRSVVEAHGGHIWHAANPDGGCTFHFSLTPEID